MDIHGQIETEETVRVLSRLYQDETLSLILIIGLRVWVLGLGFQGSGRKRMFHIVSRFTSHVRLEGETQMSNVKSQSRLSCFDGERSSPPIWVGKKETWQFKTTRG